MTATELHGPGVTSTPSFAEFLTWKQADVMMFLSRLDPDDDEPRKTTREISDFLTEIVDMMRHDPEFGLKYIGCDYASARGTLITLTMRGLTKRLEDGRWMLTDKGERWAEANV